MDLSLNKVLWQQFGASIDMLENAIIECPSELWNTEVDFWYRSYHTLFWTDYYLTKESEKFAPPTPFTLSEFDPKGGAPDNVYKKEILLIYLQHSRQKAKQLISNLTSENLVEPFGSKKKKFNTLEALLYNMRHIQHHTAQLNLLLRQENIPAPKWVSRTKH